MNKAAGYTIKKKMEETGNIQITPVNTIMAVINVVVFVVLSIIGSIEGYNGPRATEDAEFMVRHGAVFVPYISEGHEYYRLFTAMFMHFGFAHLLSNMFSLMFIGDNVERTVGKVRYILIYLLGGLLANIGSYRLSLIKGSNTVSAGASGAIFALIGALLWLVIANKGRLAELTVPKMCIMIAYSVYSGFTSGGVDNAAHICGLLAGFLLAFILYRAPKSGSKRDIII